MERTRDAPATRKRLERGSCRDRDGPNGEPNERPAAPEPPVWPESMRGTSRASTESRKPQHDKSTARLTYTTRIKKTSHVARTIAVTIPSIRGLRRLKSTSYRSQSDRKR